MTMRLLLLEAGGLSQGMNQSQLYMNMNGGKSNTNNNKASNHWAKMRKRVSHRQKRSQIRRGYLK